MVSSGVQKKLIVCAGVGVALATFTASIVVWQTYDAKSDEPKPQLPEFPGPSPSPMGSYASAAISCDAPLCADIGKAVLVDGGTVVDSAIATLFCMGVTQSASMGIGGGFIMVLYNASSRTSVALTARETAPQAAYEDMFEGDPALAARGPLSVAVPGELKGYWEMYSRYGGGLPWSRLVQPTIDLCEGGFPVSQYVAEWLQIEAEMIYSRPSMDIYIDNRTGRVYLENDVMTRPLLAETLRTIAASEFGGNHFYMDTPLMRDFVDDLKQLGGIIEYEDMLNYSTSWSEPLITNLSNGFTHITTPAPSSGLILSFILTIMDGYNLSPEILQDFGQSSATYHRFLEAMKHAYAKRTKLGDPEVGDPEHIAEVEELIRNLTSSDYIDATRRLILDHITNNTYEYYGAEVYQPENHGTSHLSIIGENEDAIAVTSTINLEFGAGIRSIRTGIVYNDEMDDFSAPNITNSYGVPPSPNNFIRPGKRPVSSMAPSIFVDQSGRVRLVIGSAGGTHITTSIAYATMRNIWLGQTIKEAIDCPRLHHQLFPMIASYENGFPMAYVKTFTDRNHTVKIFPWWESAVVGISRVENGTIFANSDYRKFGNGISGY